MLSRQRKLKNQEDEVQPRDSSWKQKPALHSGNAALPRVYLVLALLLGILFLGYIAISNDLEPMHLGRKAIDSLALSLNLQKVTYVVVIDAGSTGSRLLVYKFHSVFSTGNLVLDKEYFFEVKPGLSSYAKQPDKSALSLEPLLEKAKNVIPESEWKSTPLTMKATAGLRLLPENKANAILGECRVLLDSSGFRVLKDSVTIMEGVDEGIFSWFTVNFLLNKLGGDATVAALDLGGGSTQVTFVPDNPSDSKMKEYIHSINVFEKNMSLYTHSYLKMGLMAARKEILTLGDDQRKKNERIEYNSECINPIVSVNWSYGGQDYLMKGPVEGAHKFIKAKTSSDTDEDRPIIRFEACEKIVQNYVKQMKEKPVGLNSQIYAFSYYFDKASEAALIDPFSGGDISVENFHKAAKDICEYPNTDQPFTCLDLTYIHALLRHGFGLKDKTRIFLYKKINGHELSWALGAAFNVLEQEL